VIKLRRGKRPQTLHKTSEPPFMKISRVTGEDAAGFVKASIDTADTARLAAKDALNAIPEVGPLARTIIQVLDLRHGSAVDTGISYAASGTINVAGAELAGSSLTAPLTH
jgi:hypothetical protein